MLGLTRPTAHSTASAWPQAAGAERDRIAGDRVAVKALGDHGAMADVHDHPGRFEPAPHLAPHPHVVVDERAIVRDVQVDPLGRPPGGDVERTADGCRPATDDGDARGGSEPVVHGSAARRRRLRPTGAGVAPEAVGHPGRDHQAVERLGRLRAVRHAGHRRVRASRSSPVSSACTVRTPCRRR